MIRLLSLAVVKRARHHHHHTQQCFSSLFATSGSSIPSSRAAYTSSNSSTFYTSNSVTTMAQQPAEEYDLVTIGAGSGGTRASRFAAQFYGAKVAVVELPFGFVSSDAVGGARAQMGGNRDRGAGGGQAGRARRSIRLQCVLRCCSRQTAVLERRSAAAKRQRTAQSLHRWPHRAPPSSPSSPPSPLPLHTANIRRRRHVRDPRLRAEEAARVRGGVPRRV